MRVFLKKVFSLIMCVTMTLTLGVSLSGVTVATTNDEITIPTAIDSPVFMNKSISQPDENGYYTITLENYVTGEVITQQQTTPLDIVLVLDQSGSMEYGFSTTTRQQAMKDSVKAFIESVHTNAKKNNETYKIGIVTFSDTATIKSSLTEVKSDANNTQLQTTIDNLPSPNGATNIADGVAKAQTMLASSTATKVVILFTDGVPTTNRSFDVSVANSALSTAKQMKDKKVKIYSIGIFDRANTSELCGKYYNDNYELKQCDNKKGSYWETYYDSNAYAYVSKDTAAGNRFLNYISNNYLSASSIGIERSESGIQNSSWKITSSPLKRKSNKFYYTAQNASELNNIFTTISQTIERPNITFDSKSVVKDYLTNEFEFVENSTVTVKEAKFDGTKFLQPTIFSDAQISVKDNLLTVTNFDFSENFVTSTIKSDNTYGKKLIVQFKVKYKGNSFGGNNIPTNMGESGLYENSSSSSTDFYYNIPSVDLPINYDFTLSDKKVYITNDLQLSTIFDSDSIANVDGVKNKYVDIVYNFYDGTENVASYKINAGESFSNSTIYEMKNLLNDKNITVKCNVSPITNGSVSAKDLADKSCNIYVFRPKVEYKDSWIYRGQVANYNDNFVSVDFFNNNTDNSGLAVAPTLTYEYSPVEAAFYSTTKVDGKVFIGGTDITNYVLFVNGQNSHNGSEEANEFTVFIKECSLKITTQSPPNNGDSFLYLVVGESFAKTIVMRGSQSVTIVNLPTGTYKVSPISDWSKKYTASSTEETKQLTTIDPNGEVIFNFTPKAIDNENNWLYDEDFKDNKFSK